MSVKRAKASTKVRETTETKKLKKENDAYSILLKSIESFTTDLHQRIASHEEGNFVCSGLSVHLVLSMCALGAKDKTAQEMLDALHLDKTTFSSAFKMFIPQIKNVKYITLNIANRIFADKSIVVKESFINDVQNLFLSDVISADLHTKQTVEDVNSWCANETRNKIKQILSEDDIDPLTRMILVNCVYFKARWYTKFRSLCTRDKPFFVDKNTTINVPTMTLPHEKMMYKDLKNLNAECLVIPYDDTNYSFVIIKPKEIDGLKELENNLSKINLEYDKTPDYDDHDATKVCNPNSFEWNYINLELPKFMIESKIDLQKYLSELGLDRMFSTQANFDGISEEPQLVPPLNVGKFLQKAFIQVTEEGTEAAAITMGTLRGGGMPPPLPERDFKVDRPFLYRIVNKTWNITLFSGRVIKPTNT